MERESPRTHALDRFPAAAIRFVRALERNREAIAIRHGLSPSELRALFWIGEQGSVRPKELAAHMEMTTGGVTAISHRIVELGLLERIAHPEDRRSLFLELTPAGHAMMTEMHTDFTSMVAGSALMLSVDELAAFESALTVVATEVFSRLGR
ncbi:hypothetical protein GCM10007382_26380 [Salinibacterium xinjiangense]|uniref:DNA-binding transcriptional regulator, MarR family n=1 Tax=Salinibacterium xinjiangense TaxID=386302 RepID=A0A2C9A282_9MICO|nr:hypothetical protein GCM10007382_26380 [Salinibacterium xinjiangense]SOE73078.1 DNA-binding transcriptional regulator, MarR family [Salinibacterium xinjiangense]